VLSFETRWSPASTAAIRIYDRPDSIAGVAIAESAKEFNELKDVSVYNFSSSTRTAKQGEFVVLKNVNGFFAVLRIKEVHYKGRAGASKHELKFFYVIGKEGETDFSGYGIFE
jgi:hypothetical protein